jgi:hypothetical protein
MNFISRLFRKRHVKPRPGSLEYAFTDKKGYRYYQYLALEELPYIRKGKLQEYLNLFSCALDRNELNALLGGIRATLLDAAEGKKRPAECFSAVDKMCEEIERRQADIVHPELLLKIIALGYIREDEKPHEFSEQIEKEKMQAFKRDGGLAGFFAQSSFRDLFAFSDMSDEQLNELLMSSRARLEALNRLLPQFHPSTSVQGS